MRIPRSQINRLPSHLQGGLQRMLHGEGQGNIDGLAIQPGHDHVIEFPNIPLAQSEVPAALTSLEGDEAFIAANFRLRPHRCLILGGSLPLIQQVSDQALALRRQERLVRGDVFDRRHSLNHRDSMFGSLTLKGPPLL